MKKSEVLITTAKRTHNTVNVKMKGVEFVSSSSIKYLRVQLDPKLNLTEHKKITIAKTNKKTQNLARIMLYVGASKSTKRRLLTSVVTLQLL